MHTHNIVWYDTTYQMCYQSPSCQVRCPSCWWSEPQCWWSRELPVDWQLMHPHHHCMVYMQVSECEYVWVCVCDVHKCACVCVSERTWMRERMSVCTYERVSVKCTTIINHRVQKSFPSKGGYLSSTYVHVPSLSTNISTIPSHLDPVWISLLNSSSSPLLILRGLRL